jgi:hypothetical protein
MAKFSKKSSKADPSNGYQQDIRGETESAVPRENGR